ncbi:hypothetical protein H5410_063371 [Solanum commersonii]|uniref:Uncharacterized protein n=1 Tax=Solanum commersonii TaxID=4109 RepID=A0A9J5WDM6_SOLCO|nr:hypothetical protein H5410_063371 [Solanum commersonii]
MKSSENRNITPAPATLPEMLRWTFLVYDSRTTDDDDVVFEFNCIFGYGGNKVIRTNVTSSIQEVFRCNRPDPTVFEGERISVSLEIILPVLKLESNEKSEKALICACTMVYNVGKFLKEWELHHSKIGVEKFCII